MNDSTNWELLAKYISNDCTVSEKVEVEAWINENENNLNIYKSAKKIWNLPEENFEPSDTKTLWNNVKSKAGLQGTIEIEKNNITEDRPTLFELIYGSPFLKYAAVFIIVLSISLIYYLSTSIPTSQNYLTLNVNLGDQQQIILSDGSKIILDAGSTLKYPEKFKDNVREIQLSGEAFFEVQHIHKKPFKVIAENAVIEVLGTKFNINTFNNNNSVNVLVTDGKVALSSLIKGSNQKILTKGYFSSVDSTGNVSFPIETDVESTTSWLIGEKYFKNVLVTEVLDQIERWYDVQFKYDTTKLKNDELTLIIHKKSLTEMLELISGLTSLDYQIKGKTITLL
jgi:transmembrane sensor